MKVYRLFRHKKYGEPLEVEEEKGQNGEGAEEEEKDYVSEGL